MKGAGARGFLGRHLARCAPIGAPVGHNVRWVATIDQFNQTHERLIDATNIKVWTGGCVCIYNGKKPMSTWCCDHSRDQLASCAGLQS